MMPEHIGPGGKMDAHTLNKLLTGTLPTQIVTLHEVFDNSDVDLVEDAHLRVIVFGAGYDIWRAVEKAVASESLPLDLRLHRELVPAILRTCERWAQTLLGANRRGSWNDVRWTLRLAAFERLAGLP